MDCSNLKAVHLISTNVSSTEEENIYEAILHGMEVRMIEYMHVGIFDAIVINDVATQRDYIVELLYEPHTVQERDITGLCWTILVIL